MNGQSFDSGFSSCSSSSSNSYNCPVWSWKIDRIWSLQQKMQSQQSEEWQNWASNKSTETNFYLESLKYGADLQSSFLPEKKKLDLQNGNQYNTRKSNYIWLDSKTTIKRRQNKTESMYQS